MSEADPWPFCSTLSKSHCLSPKIVTTQILKTPNSSISFPQARKTTLPGHPMVLPLKTHDPTRIPRALPAFISAMQVQVALREATYLRELVGYLWLLHLQLNQLQL